MTAFTSKWSPACLQEHCIFNTVKRELLKVTPGKLVWPVRRKPGFSCLLPPPSLHPRLPYGLPQALLWTHGQPGRHLWGRRDGMAAGAPGQPLRTRGHGPPHTLVP